MYMQKQYPDDLLNTGNAAKLVGVGVDQIRRLSKQGRLPFIRSALGHRLFKRGDVEKLVAERRANPPQPGRPSTKRKEKASTQ